MARPELPKHVVEAARQGDPAAFRQVVERYQAGVFKLALRMTHSETEAADLTQEIFLRIYRFFHKFDPQRPLTPWLYKVATNTALNHLKARTRDEPVRPTPALAPSASETLERKETEELVRWAVAQLPAKLRAAVSLYYLKELSLKEMADALDAPPSTAKVWLFRARQALKRMLEDKLES